MRNSNDLPTFADVHQAWLDCRRRKRNTEAAIDFSINIADNLVSLHDDLISGDYRICPSTCFVVTKPKPREVWAADFRDRVVHHVLFNHVGERFIRAFSPDSCACINGRGTIYAAQRLERKIRRASKNWTVDLYYLKCDLSNFFNSIDKHILFNQFCRRVHEPWWQALAHQIIFHDPVPTAIFNSSPGTIALLPPHKSLMQQPDGLGLPIGDFSSQFLANVHLDDLDQFVQHAIRPMGYIRYVDDFVLLHTCPRFLNDAKARIETKLGELGQQLNPRKTVLQPACRGVDFVGYVILPHRTCIRRKIRRAAKHALSDAETRIERRDRCNSYMGLMRHGDNFTARAKLAKIARAHGHAHDNPPTRIFA